MRQFCHVKLNIFRNGKVVVGSNDLISNGKEYSVKRFVSHPDYTTHRTIANDIAVIILSEDDRQPNWTIMTLLAKCWGKESLVILNLVHSQRN
jgi:hypothetical protein